MVQSDRACRSAKDAGKVVDVEEGLERVERLNLLAANAMTCSSNLQSRYRASGRVRCDPTLLPRLIDRRAHGCPSEQTPRAEGVPLTNFGCAVFCATRLFLTS